MSCAKVTNNAKLTKSVKTSAGLSMREAGAVSTTVNQQRRYRILSVLETLLGFLEIYFVLKVVVNILKIFESV